LSLDLGPSGAANAKVRIPEAHVAWAPACHVDLHQLTAWEDVGNREQHVDELGNASAPGEADLHERLEMIGVFKFVTSGTDFRPCFTVDPDVS